METFFHCFSFEKIVSCVFQEYDGDNDSMSGSYFSIISYESRSSQRMQHRSQKKLESESELLTMRVSSSC
jgi:hypothetical protein